jgi:large subunit ribosomal protein L21
VEKAKVIAEVLGEGKGEKVIVFKYKPKVHYRRKKGHRQIHTKLAIKEIVC